MLCADTIVMLDKLFNEIINLMKWFMKLWTNPGSDVKMDKNRLGYMFPVFELILENGHRPTGAQPSGTDYHQHFMVLKLCQNLRNCIACCNFVLCMYVCIKLLILYLCSQGIAEKQPFWLMLFSLIK